MTDATPSREDIVIIARAAGLSLPPAYLDELVSAYWRVREMAARLPMGRAYDAEPAHIFVANTFLTAKERTGLLPAVTVRAEYE